MWHAHSSDPTRLSRCATRWFRTCAIVHFKRLGSRHIHKEIELPYCVFGFNEIICKTCLKPIQTLTHKCNIIKEEHFVAIWSQTMYLCGIHNFVKCVHRKGVTSFYAMTPILTCIQLYLNTSHWQLPFYSMLVTRRPYLGRGKWRLRYRFFPIIKFHWHFDILEKD